MKLVWDPVCEKLAKNWVLQEEVIRRASQIMGNYGSTMGSLGIFGLDLSSRASRKDPRRRIFPKVKSEESIRRVIGRSKEASYGFFARPRTRRILNSRGSLALNQPVGLV